MASSADKSPLSSIIDVPASDATLADVRAPVANELEEFQDYFRETMRSDVQLLDKVTQYVLKQKGKQIRPTLVLLSAKLFGHIRASTYRAAALVELLHTATLVHDDVVDEANERRGVFSVNALWKNKVSVLFGDFLLSRGLLLSLDHQDYAILHALSDAIRRMSEGELLQIEKSRFLNIDEETYLKIISDKTASLISACMRAGALSANADDDSVDELAEAGERLGIAFQIRDDLFDYGPSKSGKPMGIDLQEKKMTLPLIHALKETGRIKRHRIRRIVRKDNKSKQDVETVRSFVLDQGGFDYARSMMYQYAQETLDILAKRPPTPARDALVQLVHFTVQRET